MWYDRTCNVETCLYSFDRKLVLSRGFTEIYISSLNKTCTHDTCMKGRCLIP